MSRFCSSLGLACSALLALGTACDGSDATARRVSEVDVYRFASGCFAIADDDGQWLRAHGDRYAFSAPDRAEATPFFLKAASLATYLLYDPGRGYVVGDNGSLRRRTRLRSDVTEQVSRYESPAEWVLEAISAGSDPRFHLRHRKTNQLMALDGMTGRASHAASIRFEPVDGCAEHPELSLDATGDVATTTFDDGAVFGIVEPHTHIMSNHGFGGGGVFHGAPFHRLGVEHALSDCDETHGIGGIRDVFGTVFEGKLSADFLFKDLIPELLSGNLAGAFHETRGYPEFTEWPAAPSSSTHQVQYYRWIERAWMGGLRLMVQHAVSNSVICELSEGLRLQTPRHGCTDMASVDRSIEEIYEMEQYIDAQSGGPGQGFFRIVTSAAEARRVIEDGKLAVVLGIETSNLFDCLLTPRDGSPRCDEAYVRRTLDDYYRRGIRAMFPVHKFDNAFSAGDGSRDFIEFGNFINSGHLSNFVNDGCPDNPAPFDRGDVAFGGLNEPRNEFASRPPYDTSHVSRFPLLTLAPVAPKLLSGGLQGNYCQKFGLTRLGEFLLREMMKRGMIIEVDHLPRHAYRRAFDMFAQFGYPPAATHGTQGVDGQVYALGGISKTNTGTCRDPNRKGATLGALRSRIELKRAKGAYPGEAMSYDLNGFAGAPGPRFGPRSNCGTPQTDPVTYPFQSYAGDVTFTRPRVGNRTIDFNTEGLAHIGLLPEIIDDLRRDAESDDDLEPLFRSAEAYLRMWEKAEGLGAILSQGPDDDCPLDPDKTELGICGCGVPDTDSDGDGTADCQDLCADDPGKAGPGICGCGTPDADADSDGVPDCNDRCPDNPDKTDQGMCGCAAAETDSDGDGVQDCLDSCPDDPGKIDPGQCGCGTSDVDSDGDGASDCLDSCPGDGGKTEPGICGCGATDVDSDGDGSADCNDFCPSDPGKTSPGSCGCGVAEGTCGLMGTYFYDRDLREPVLQRLDATVNFDWGRGHPHPAMEDHDFSVRWTGTVQAPASGTFTFYLVSDDGSRLWVNDRLIIDDWSKHSARERSGAIALDAGRRYDIRVEYFEAHVDATVTLSWSGPGTPKQVVPQSRLVAVPPRPAHPARGSLGDSLTADQALYMGESLTSRDGRYRVVLQHDANLVVYRNSDGRPLWASNTVHSGAGRLTVQGDSNLVLYRGWNTGRALWASNTVNRGGNPRLVMQNDGNLVLYTDRGAVWATGTNGR